MEFTILQAGLLFLAALIAGWIDAIAGGGGMITLPSLLAVGLPPHLALGTNKLQSTFGSFTATYNHVRRGVVDLRAAVWGIVATGVGAGLGALVVQKLKSELLEAIIPFLLLGLVIYFVLSPRLGERDVVAKIKPIPFFISFGLLIGFYDGFFGPGTGSFWAMSFVLILGYNLVKATGYTKLMNFVSNIMSLLAFVIGGHVALAVGLLMGIGQMIGAYVGSHLVITRGARFVRPILIVVVLLTTAKLLYDNFK